MQAYSERLGVPASWWALTVLMAVSGALVGLAFGLVATIVLASVLGALTAWATSAYGAVRITVTETELLAGRARIPLTALGAGVALDPEQARSLRMENANPRAFMVLRAYIPGAARIEVTDPADPTPYLYLSSRNPQRLVDVVAALRARA
ncbi:DUF3093 domain-containing protein [Embleya scabrispora]|uniref:DUF3093 domain-containing protein n=1 Tax=Embleya scabrispora TaxID=159449 RepID=UPI00037C7D34|nr:DUF3093 domain-containing protein [Embleya scabrispora]MYS88033.1 DUF3093 family protein [Streptomyces sp. SID5474]